MLPGHYGVGCVLSASLSDDPEHWRQRAAEARELAKQEHDPVSRAMILQMAEEYERLAERIVIRLRGRRKARGHDSGS